MGSEMCIRDRSSSSLFEWRFSSRNACVTLLESFASSRGVASMRSSARSPRSHSSNDDDDESKSTALPHIGTNHDGSRIIFNRDVRAKRNECVFAHPKCVLAYLQKKTNEPEDAWVVLTFLECFIFVVLPGCLLYTSPSPRDATLSRMPSSA